MLRVLREWVLARSAPASPLARACALHLLCWDAGMPGAEMECPGHAPWSVLFAACARTLVLLEWGFARSAPASPLASTSYLCAESTVLACRVTCSDAMCAHVLRICLCQAYS